MAERPQLILSAEAELGIAAGLQDRVIQVLCFKPVAHKCKQYEVCSVMAFLPSAARHALCR